MALLEQDQHIAPRVVEPGGAKTGDVGDLRGEELDPP